MTNFYQVLGLNETASDETIKKAYRTYAKKYHPDRNLHSTEESENKFKKITEAYDTLSDPIKKKNYDQKDDLNPRFFFNPSTTSFFHHQTSFQKSPFDGMKKFMERQNPSSLQIHVKCTLEELYKGVTKNIKIVRRRLNNQKLVSENKTFELVVKPGWKHGTKITFQKEGDQSLDGYVPAADIIFNIEQVVHPQFVRIENDLIYVKKISLIDVITGVVFDIQTLDKKTITVRWDDVHVTPNYEQYFSNYGMPCTKTQQFGKLIVKPQIEYTRFKASSSQKAKIRETLLNLV